MEQIVISIVSMLISAGIAIFGAYAATKKAAEERERERDQKMNERDIEIKTELASMGTELRLLSERVEKHNNVVERMTRAEVEIDNLYHRYDEIKIGGTE